MWWVEDDAMLKKVAIAGVLAVGLAGCFRPLYGAPEFNGAQTQTALAGVTVTIRTNEADRLAHYVRNELEFNLRGGDAAVTPRRYDLTVTVVGRTTTAVIDRAAGVAESAVMVFTATYILREIGKSAALNEGTAFVNVSYDRSQQRFANTRAARDAEIQGARVLADQIRSRVAAFLATR
jgi:LPS-assembly lipoprotein